MLFRRRERPDFLERLRVSLWPRRSWGRSGRYVIFRLSRLRATPYAIAIGAASGVFVSFTPFMGLHFILGGIIAWMLRGSIIASALGTFVGNPLTFPFIWFGAYEFGSWMLGSEATKTHIDLSQGVLHTSIDKLILPMTLGGVPMGLLAGAITFFIVRKLVEAYQEKRRPDDIEPDPDQRTARA